MKLETLVKMPANRRCLSADEEECHSDVQRAYGLLLSACKMKGRPAPVQVSDQFNFFVQFYNLIKFF